PATLEIVARTSSASLELDAGAITSPPATGNARPACSAKIGLTAFAPVSRPAATTIPTTKRGATQLTATTVSTTASTDLSATQVREAKILVRAGATNGTVTAPTYAMWNSSARCNT